MRSGFEERVRRFYDENRQGLLTYALSLTCDREQAEDVIQAVFFKLLQRDRLPRELRPYLFRSVRNAVIDGARRDRHRAVAAADESSPRTTDDDPVRDRVVSQCLSRLPEHERNAVVLKIYGGLTFAEIGAIDKTSVNTAAARYRRGLERMRVLLGGDS